MVREVREEAGIEIEDKLIYLNNVAFIRSDGILVILVKFAVKYKCGQVVSEPGAFIDYAWVNASEVENYDCILGVKEEVSQTIELFKNYSPPQLRRGQRGGGV